MIPVTPADKVAEWWHRARPDLDTTPMGVFGRLRRLQVLFDLEIDALLSGSQLSSSELDVLVIMRHAEQPMIARGIAALRGCSRAAMSNMLGKLEKRGLVLREASQADRRATLIRLSEEGIRLVDETFPRRLAVESDLLAGLAEEEQVKITEAFDLLLRAMLRHSPLDGNAL